MSAEVRGRQLKRVTFYLRENFCLTTAGHFRTQALIDTLTEVGSDRLLLSVDHPYEAAQEQSDWFDSLVRRIAARSVGSTPLSCWGSTLRREDDGALRPAFANAAVARDL
jgi:hypothetical protein